MKNSIEKTNIKLAELRSIYVESDSSIQNLKLKREKLLDELNQNIKSYLKTQKKIATSRMNAAKRPKEVLIEYAKLKREAAKDQFIFDFLETQYRNILLEKSKNQDPWELITKPTILPYPVEPIKRKIVALSALLAPEMSSFHY